MKSDDKVKVRNFKIELKGRPLAQGERESYQNLLGQKNTYWANPWELANGLLQPERQIEEEGRL